MSTVLEFAGVRTVYVPQLAKPVFIPNHSICLIDAHADAHTIEAVEETVLATLAERREGLPSDARRSPSAVTTPQAPRDARRSPAAVTTPQRPRNVRGRAKNVPAWAEYVAPWDPNHDGTATRYVAARAGGYVLSITQDRDSHGTVTDGPIGMSCEIAEYDGDAAELAKDARAVAARLLELAAALDAHAAH